MKDWMIRITMVVFAGLVVNELINIGYKNGYNEAVNDAQELVPDLTSSIVVTDNTSYKCKKATTFSVVRDFIKGAKKSNIIRELITNPEDHSAYAYVEDGMIKIEIRNRMDH